MNVRISVLKTLQDGALKGSVYIPELDDVWSFICVIEDDIYAFSWDTNKSDPCWVCNHVIDIKCKGGFDDCSYYNMVESLIEEFQEKIINKHQGRGD